MRRRTSGRRAGTVGRVREKLAELLTAQGIDVDPFNLRWADGQNSHVTEDCVRWDAYVESVTRDDCVPMPPGVKTYIYSWDTMTKCVSHGIVVTKDTDMPWSLEIHANTD